MDVTALPHVDPIVLPAGGRHVRVTSADGTPIHTTVFGADDAPAIILIHGFSQQSRTWAYQVTDLMDDFRVIVYDQRGHGRSGQSHRYTTAALGDDLHAVLAATLRPGERAVLAGHSMGGITIMSWAQRYRDEVGQRAAAAVLVNTAPSEIGVHFAVLGVPRPLHRFSNYVVRNRLMTIIQTRARRPLRFLAFGATAHPTHVDAVLDMLREAPPRTLREFINALLAADLTRALPAVTCPTVIIAGSRDRMLPPVHSSRMVTQLPHLTQLRLLADSGHMSPWECREIVSGVLRETGRASYWAGSR